MHESCEYDIVGERTGETFKTAWVLKVSYKWVKENKYARFIKKNKKNTHLRKPVFRIQPGPTQTWLYS